MKRKLIILSTVLIAIIALFFTISCGEDTNPPSDSTSPVISSIYPESGTAETEVSITLSNFDSKSSNVGVKFGSKYATINFVSDTLIKVKAPAGINDMAVSLTVIADDKESNAKTFTYVSPPQITEITGSCFYNASVVIYGNNFSANIEENTVKYGAIEGTIKKATKTSLTVIVPNFGDATSVDVTVTKNNLVSNAVSIQVDVDQHKVATYNWITHTVKSGITYKTGQFNLFGSVQRRIYMLDVTLDEINTLGIGFNTVNQTTVDICNSYNASVGINAGYFPMSGASDKDPYIRINGTTVQEGHLGASRTFTNAALLIHNNVARVRKFTESGTNLNLIAAAIPVSQAENVIVSGPMLITDGTLESLSTTTSHNTSSTARTGLGVSEDGKRVFIVVVDTGGDVTGVTTPQLSKILQALGAYSALNFDGGGSSTMYVKNLGLNGLVNLPYGNTTQRKVRSVIYVK